MNLFKNFDWSARSIVKIIAVFLVGVLALGVAVAVLMFVFRTVISPFTSNFGMGGASYEMAMDQSYSAKGISLSSARNILPPVPTDDGQIVDPTAEDYEVKNYSATYRPNDKTEICATVLGLKSDPEIIFSNSSESDSSCYFTFTAPVERIDEILVVLNSLDPDDLNSNIYTIQRSVEGTSDQLDILQQKLAQTESTLSDAQEAYEDLMRLATNSRDVENLTQLIRLKIDAIEQLAQARISINQEIQQVQNNRSELLRQIANADFNVSVYEQKFIDWKQIGEDWKQEIRNFVSNVVDVTKLVSLKLVSFVMYTGIAILYAGISFIFLKLLWTLAKKVWKFGTKK